MKILLLLGSLIFYLDLFAKDYFYQVEENDQLGMIFLSLGHSKLWPKDGQVNLFKKNFNPKLSSRLLEGNILRIKEEDILFKKNILIEGDFFKIIIKAKNLEQFDTLLRLENTKEKQVAEIDPALVIEAAAKKISQEFKESDITQSINLYSGIGAFVSNDSEKDRSTTSSTFSGLQPMVQLKGIYSNSSFGSIGIDLLAKKIINDKYSFPINADYRIQLIPKWNFTNFFRFAFSHSIIAHSYVGKSSDTDIAYKLNSNFIGFGVVIPRENFWLEVFLEKAYSGKTASSESTQEALKGMRFDSELVYSISEKWRIIPGLNYYQLKQNSSEYSLSVIELRTVLTRSFDF